MTRHGSDRTALCVASPDAAVRRRAAEVLVGQGHPVVAVGSLLALAEAAGRERLSLAVVDPRLSGLGEEPMATLRAEPALHRCPVMVLGDADLRGLRGRGAEGELIDLILRVHSQLAGDEHIALLNRINEALTASEDLEATMAAVLDVAASVLRFDTGTLFLMDPLGRLRVRAARGYQLADEQLRSFAPGEGVVGWVVSNRVASIVGDSDRDGRFATFHGAPGSRSMLAAPILLGQRTLGALTLVRRAPAPQFTDADVLPVSALANSAAIALENARLHEQERTLALHLEEIEELYGREKAINDRLDEYDRVYTQVVSTVSHELKTPLMSIRGFAQMIRDGDVGEEEARDFGGEIHDNAVRLSRYVERILQEDSVHSGRVALELTEVQLAPLVDEVLRSLRNLVSEGHVLANNVPADLPPVSADADKLSRILFNLVSNAIKYSPQGGPVTVTALAGAREMEFAVEDHGLGVPASERERVFERFYRTSSAAKITGTGLGLSIVSGLVEVHGGRIRVEPNHPRGSRFVVTLPLAHAVAAAASAPVAAAPRHVSAPGASPVSEIIAHPIRAS